MLNLIINLVFAVLSLALVLSFLRLVRGPTLPDRVVALELLVSITVGFIAVHSIATGIVIFLDVAVVLSLTAFLAAIGFARFLERGGQRDD